MSIAQIYDIYPSSYEKNNEYYDELFCFGRTESNESVCLRVRNVPYYLYMSLPEEWEDNGGDIQDVRSKLNWFLIEQNKGFLDRETGLRREVQCTRTHCIHHDIAEPLIVDINDVDIDDDEDEIEDKKTMFINNDPCVNKKIHDTVAISAVDIVSKYSFLGYAQKPKNYARFTFTRSYYVRAAKQRLWKMFKDPKFSNLSKCELFEASDNPTASFMRIISLPGFGWVEFNNQHYVNDKLTHCQHEYIVSINDCKVRDDLIREQTAYKSLYFDIECYSDRANPFKHPVISIAFECRQSGKTLSKDVITFKKREDVDDVITGENYNLILCKNEIELFETIRRYIIDSDADFICGWNSNRFDIPYLINRALYLKIENFLCFSKMKKEAIVFLRKTSESRQAGAFDEIVYIMPGRTPIDMMMTMRKNVAYKLRKYSLQFVSVKYLKTSFKDDLTYKEIVPHFDGDQKMRCRLFKYNMVDTELTYKIAELLGLIDALISEAKVYYTMFVDIIDRGKQFRLSMFARKYMQEYIMPIHEKDYSDPDNIRIKCKMYDRIEAKNPVKTPDEIIQNHSLQQTNISSFFNETPGLEMDIHKKSSTKKKAKPRKALYAGAFVLPPKIDLYDENHPIVTMDYASLYPSIMRRYNMCLTTLIELDHAISIGLDPEKDLYKTDLGYYFVRPHIKEGIIPKLLKDLMDLRNSIKDDMEKYPQNSVQWMIRNGLQNAVKACTNSYYGATGASTGELFCVYIAASVTSYGQYYIKRTRDYVLQYPDFKEYQLDVVYGDTDSIMICLNNFVDKSETPLKQALALGYKIADAINNSGYLEDPMKIAFEKVMCPYLLLAKKRYVGMIYEGKKEPKLKQSGTASVRRDGCLYLSETIDEMARKMIKENKTKKEVYDFIKEKIRALLNGEVPLEKLTITQNYSKSADQYVNPVAHIEAAKLYGDRPDAPQVGDRIEYLFIKNDKHKGYEKAKPPFYVTELGEQIDYEHYLEKQLKLPICGMLEFLFKDEDLQRLFDVHRYPRIVSSSKPNAFSSTSHVKRIKMSKEEEERIFNAPVRKKLKHGKKLFDPDPTMEVNKKSIMDFFTSRKTT